MQVIHGSFILTACVYMSLSNFASAIRYGICYHVPAKIPSTLYGASKDEPTDTSVQHCLDMKVGNAKKNDCLDM